MAQETTADWQAGRLADHLSGCYSAAMHDTLTKAQQIWQVLAQVPPGKVVSYGLLAEMTGLPGYARFVGTTLKQLPDDSRLPWHRVVNAAGRISFAENSPRFIEQKQRLQSEGVIFNSNRIDLIRYRWDGA